MAEGKKYFWLRLKRDFFKRHDIRIIESMPNGKDYLLFYLKLLCESVDHEGTLRFNNEIPYNEEMLSIITNTNVDIVRSAIKIFTELGMMDILDDGTFFMNEVEKMMGSSSQDEHTRESTRLRVQAYRERQKSLKIPNDDDTKRYSNVTCNGEIDIELDIEKEKENKSTNTCTLKEKTPNSRFSKPTIEEIEEYVKSYCLEKYYTKPLIDAQTFYDFYESKNWFVGKNKMKDWKASVRMWVSKKIEERPSILNEDDDELGDFQSIDETREEYEERMKLKEKRRKLREQKLKEQGNGGFRSL